MSKKTILKLKWKLNADLPYKCTPIALPEHFANTLITQHKGTAQPKYIGTEDAFRYNIKMEEAKTTPTPKADEAPAPKADTDNAPKAAPKPKKETK